jgi:phosphoribosylformylglycinamidine (FGAM) synthase-like enzyme
VALSECCTSELGAKVSIPVDGSRERTLFGESPSRILVTVRDTAQAVKIAAKFGVACPHIGVIMKERLQIADERNEMLIDLSTSGLKQAFETSLPRLLQAQHD